METLNKIVGECKSCLRFLGREFPGNITKCIFTKESSTLYAKLSNRYMTDEITTLFYKINGDEDEKVNPKKYLNKKCFAKAAVRFNNIYIGNTTSLQIKLEEVSVMNQRQRLIR